MDHNFSKADTACSNADRKNASSTNSDYDPTSCSDCEVTDEKGSFNQINCSSKETECIMESKLACTLVLALALLIGFSVFAGEAKASEFNPAAFQSVSFSAVACCNPDFNTTAFNASHFSQSRVNLKAFAFTNPEFQGTENRSFSGNFVQDADVTADNFRSAGFKDFAGSFQNDVRFAAASARFASFDDKTFQGGNLFQSTAFTLSTLRGNDFQVTFEGAAFDNGVVSFACCKGVGFAGNNFQEFDGQFQSQG